MSVSKMIGNNLRAIRLQHNLTQKQVAKYLGVSFQQLQKYETGKNQVSSSRLMQFHEIYGVPYDVFFQDTVECPSDEDILKRLKRVKDPVLRFKIVNVINILMTSA